MARYDWTPFFSAINGAIDDYSERQQYAGLLGGGAAGGAPSSGLLSGVPPEQLEMLRRLPPKVGMKMLGDMMKPSEYDTTPRFTQDGKAYTLGKNGSVKWLDGITPREKAENINGVAVNMFEQKPGSVLPQDITQPFVRGQNGGPTPNRPVQDFQMGLRRAGRPQTTVNVNADKPFAAALGTGAAGILEASSNAARGGAQTLGTVNQLRAAINTGKVMSGPGTTAIQFFNQVAGGDPAKLQATRATMQGLAKLTLDARGSLKGQGTITDREQALLERAVSGDLDRLTIPEIRTITDVAERAAKAAIAANRSNVERARAVPGSGNVVDFYNVDEPAAAPTSAPQVAPNAAAASPQAVVDELRRRGLVK